LNNRRPDLVGELGAEVGGDDKGAREVGDPMVSARGAASRATSRVSGPSWVLLRMATTVSNGRF
jgi:hypothetical protein